MASQPRVEAPRTALILQELLRTGRVSVDSLSQQLQVNASTIRRDLEKLEQQNLLRRVHGGAVPVDTLAYSAYAHDLTFQANMSKQVEEKARIALAAARRIQPGDTLALSPGTTTTHLARSIRHLQLPNLTVVTNAVNIAMELAGLRDLNLILTGGIVLPDFFAMVGPLAEQSLSEMFVDKAFIGVTGLSAEHGLTGPNQLEALTYRATIQRAREVIVLADHTKLERVALYRIAPMTAVHTVITDAAATPEIIARLEAMGLAVHAV
jgi:DeoR/GlpR family transcriptional regulator of sugar metabolism